MLLEDEDMLKKWALTSGTPVEHELAKKGIVPIQHGAEQTSKLGSGRTNTVLDVIYKGRRAVARMSEDMDELDKMVNFVSKANSLPAKYRKHFPKILTTFDLEIESEHSIEYYYGAVVEQLDPMPPGLEFDLDHQSLVGNLQRSRASAVLNNHKLVEDIADDATDIKDVRDELITMYELDIRGKLLSFVGKPINDFDEYLVGVIDKHADGRKFNRAYYKFGRGLLTALRGATIPHEPTSSRAEKQVAIGHPSRKVREFYEFLEALKNAGMEWSDLHTGNFMVRRETGDFVVVDPGDFLDLRGEAREQSW